MTGVHHAVIALGGNVGNSIKLLQFGVRELRAAGVQVLRTSNMYTSKPMHVTEQPKFFNAAVLVETSLDAGRLLQRLKAIEISAGRDLSAQRWGPRLLDMDIIFYDDASVQTADLTIPHPRWQERPFVQQPIRDLITTDDADHHLKVRCRLEELQSLRGLTAAAPDSDDLQQVFPLGDGRVHVVGSRTLVMAILNATPDSFSDGGSLASTSDAERHAIHCLEAGADIIDVGGQSTRPGAPLIGAEQELERVLPVIQRLSRIPECVISVDTFYAKVAREAVAAGAHVVNDITAGKQDPDMLSTVADLGVPYVMMHMRGSVETMHGADSAAYADLPAEVGAELQAAAGRAVAAGIEAWRIMLDPGLGFSKSAQGNCELIAGLRRMQERGLHGGFQRSPLLLGPSRKGFLGRLTGRKQASDRDFASAGAVAACVGLGADVVRVHNVQGCRDSVRVADGIFRRWWPKDDS